MFFLEINWNSDTYSSNNIISSSEAYAAYRHPTNTELYDSSYYQVSAEGLSYFMDPRNFLNETDVFQFFDLSAAEEVSIAAVESVLAGTFMEEAMLENGKNFSGGQRQRLTVARALVRKAEILILDDSSSALDYATDAALRGAIKALPYSPTVFLISQRTSSIRHADLILVFEDGRVVGSGTHDDLLRTCEVYREIHESQFRKEEQA